MSSSPSVPLRAALVALVLFVVGFVAPTEVEAGGRVRPYKEGGAIRLDTDLLSVSGLSAWTIDEYLEANTPLPRLGSAFLAAERRYGINAKFLLAAALHESNWGRSGLSRAKHNLFGYNAYDRDPFKYATAFDGYAAGIDGVARFMKESYLVPSGRWWVGGAPTLRSMQRFWSSSGVWGVNVSRIASSLRFESLRSRKIVFSAPVLPDIVRTGDPLPVDLTWRGGRVPGGITYRATWTQISAAPTGGAVETLSASAGPGASEAPGAPAALGAVEPAQVGEPGRLGMSVTDFAPGLRVPPPATPAAPFLEPFSVKAKRTALARASAGLRLVAPAEPGEYLLTVSLRDRDGKVLPRADERSIPPVRVQVAGDWAVRYQVERLAGDGVRVTATNVGHRPIPVNSLPVSVADRLGPGAVEQTVLALRGYDRVHPHGNEVAAVALAEPLGRGASVSLVVADLDAVVSAAETYLVPELLVHGDPDRLAGSRPAGFWHQLNGS